MPQFLFPSNFYFFIYCRRIQLSMNSSKRNFLERFNGKIGFVTKHGELICRSSFEGQPQPKMGSEDCSISSQKFPKVYTPFGKNNHQKQNLNRSRMLERSQAGSVYKYSSALSNVEKKEKPTHREKRSDTKQKLLIVGVNSLEQDLLKTRNKHEIHKTNSLSWEIKDQQTKDFYQELTNLQMSKALSFNHHPKVHL